MLSGRTVVACAAALCALGAEATASAAAPERSAEEVPPPEPASAPSRYDINHYAPNDLDHVRYTLYPHMSTSSSSPSSLQNLNGDLHEVDAQVAFPIVTNGGKTRLVAGVNYVYTRYALSGLQAANLSSAEGLDAVQTSPVPQDLHAITALLGLTQALSDHWAASFALKPGVLSDLRVLDSASLSLQGGAVFSYAVSNDFRVGLGLSYQSRFGSPLLLPAGILDWHIGGPFKLRIAAPEAAELLVIPSDRLVLNLFGRVTGGAYRIHPDATLSHTDPTSHQITSQPVTFAYDLSYSTISVGAGARVRVAGGLYAVLEVPLALNRRWDANNLCWDRGGHTECVDGPSSVSLANAGKLSVGGTAGFELRY